MTPCRVVDTRPGPGFTGPFGPPMLAGGSPRTFPILSSTNCLIPDVAKAYSFKLTVVPSGPLGFLTVAIGRTTANGVNVECAAGANSGECSHRARRYFRLG